MIDSIADVSTNSRPVPARPDTPSILVVGPGARGRGGIASVIRMHQETATWSRYRTRLLPTFDDRNVFHKIRSALSAYLAAPLLILRADLVHIHLAAQTSMFRKLPIFLLARMMRRPVIVHIHAPSRESLLRDTPSWTTHLLFRHASRVVTLSQSWADIVAVYEPSARIVVLPNPVRISNAMARRDAGPPVILFVGKLEARKGYGDLLAAASAILDEFPEAQFWFAGHGEVEPARMQAEQLGISLSVRLLGWVGSEELDRLYRQADVLALPSYAEGVPMSVIEAMSHGVPVVCTPVGGLPELIRNGENGVFVDPGDVPSLARQIIGLLREPARADAIGFAGRATVQQSCSLDRVSSALDALYSDVLAEG